MSVTKTTLKYSYEDGLGDKKNKTFPRQIAPLSFLPFPGPTQSICSP